MPIINEDRSIEQLRSLVNEMGIEKASYFLWETEFWTSDEDQVQKEIEKILG